VPISANCPSIARPAVKNTFGNHGQCLLSNRKPAGEGTPRVERYVAIAMEMSFVVARLTLRTPRTSSDITCSVSFERFSNAFL
jgi:hypothetical protein